MSGDPWHPVSAVDAGRRGLPAEDRDHQLLFLLGQSFSLSVGLGFRVLNFVICPGLFVPVWLWFFSGLCLHFVGSNSWPGYA